jgi:Double zinc ribbon
MCGGHFGPFYAMVALANSQPPLRVPVQEKNVRSGNACWSCRSPVNPEFTWCPICGLALKPIACCYCGQLISIREDHCTHCGAPKRDKTTI